MNDWPQTVGVAIGSLLLCGGLLWLFNSLRRLWTFERAEGMIVSLTKSVDHDGDTVYTPVIRYDTGGGIYHCSGRVNSTSPTAYRVGAKMLVLYPPYSPDQGMAAEFIFLFMPPVILAVLGISVIAGTLLG